MNRPSPVAAGLAVTPSSTPASGGFVRPSGPSQRTRPLLRKYEMTALDAAGNLVDMGRLAPASLPFEDSFAALARGALIATPDGPSAIEDILPGDVILTTHTGPQIVQWVGAMTLVPTQDHSADKVITPRPLTRIAADSLGLNRPMPDLVLGPAARVLHQLPAFRSMYGTSACLAQASSLVDGDAIVDIRPASPVKLFQLQVPIHDTILVNGVEIETHHPGPQIAKRLSKDLLSLYLSMYPGITRLDDFGPLAHPRLSAEEVAKARAA